MKTIELSLMADATCSLLNKFVSQGITPLFDQVFPGHDGKADHAAAADMVELRQTLHSLVVACEAGIYHLSEVIASYEEAIQ